MTIESLRARFAALEHAACYEPEQFQARAEVIDAIAFEIIDHIDWLPADPQAAPAVHALRREAEQLQQRLEAVDAQLFHHLRTLIRGGCRGVALQQTIEQYLGGPIADAYGKAVVGYDHLDRFVNGLFGNDAVPEARREPEAEMVLYQQTPARIMFEVIHRAQLGPQDVFYDLGCGLGHIPLLVHLLSGARARGVEFEPAFCEHAQACAAALGLTEVMFRNEDARYADYAEGTVFFLYTPFEGAMLLEVLGRLETRARRGPIRLATYGPCTFTVAKQAWLSPPTPAEPGGFRLAIFQSQA